MKAASAYIGLLLLITTLFSSCKKLLEEKPNNRLAVPETLENLQALLDEGVTMNRLITPSFGEGSSDDYFLPGPAFDSRSEKDKNFYTWMHYENYVYPNDWSLNYFPVFNANYCLETLDKTLLSTNNKEQWDNIKGSALFYRSYYFLQLLWTYSKAYDDVASSSDLGIALRNSSDFNIPSTRASVKDCYDKIIKDATEAINYLPDLPNHTFRPSRPAAYGLLARAYLSMRKYDSAFRYADLCLQLRNNLVDCNGDPDFNGVNASFPFKQFNKETIFYTEMNLTCTNINTSVAKIDTTLYTSYALNDLRRNSFFRLNGGYQQFKGSYTGSTRHFTGIATDEMFLIRAECLARKQELLPALADLNRLLEKRYNASFIPVTAADSQEALLKILVERRKELVMRGLRWMDIKRLNKENANITPTRFVNGISYVLPPNDNRYALPLPREIIVETGMAQNPK